jgi:lipopolysaccharide transport system ATP-binding protein
VRGDDMSDLAIRVEKLGKQYRIGGPTAPYRTLREQLGRAVAAPLRALRRGERGDDRLFWALRDVSFEVRRGEVVGIVGRNGAGKSTLLKVLSRITEPTAGEVDLHGRVGSLLEVGTGFHPELTGRENVYLNGAILGMTRREIARKFDEIVAFAEVEKFLDTPVKHYSSGMYMRLAFAVAAHLEPEILVVDEVLAVGDAAFQKKCLGKMGDVAREGRTVLLVSHNAYAISRLCAKGICLEAGSVVRVGSVREALSAYHQLLEESAGKATTEQWERRLGNGDYRFEWVKPEKQVYAPGEVKVFHFSLRKRREVPYQLSVSAHILDGEGMVLVQCDSRLVGVEFQGRDVIDGTFALRTPWLKPGEYTADFFICASTGGIVDWYQRACKLSVQGIPPYPHCGPGSCYESGCVFADFDWNILPEGRG